MTYAGIGDQEIVKPSCRAEEGFELNCIVESTKASPVMQIQEIGSRTPLHTETKKPHSIQRPDMTLKQTPQSQNANPRTRLTTQIKPQPDEKFNLQDETTTLIEYPQPHIEPSLTSKRRHA